MNKIKEKIKNNVNKKILYIIMLIILLIIDIIMYSKFIYNDRSYYTNNYLSYDTSFKEDGKIEISQKFIAKRNHLEAISIGFDKSFRTYNEEDINIKVIDLKNKKIVAEYNNIYDEILQDEKVYKFGFTKQNSKDQMYE